MRSVLEIRTRAHTDSHHRGRQLGTGKKWGEFCLLRWDPGPCDVAPQESLCFNSFHLFTSSVHLIHITEAGEHPLCILIHLYEILELLFMLSHTSYLGIQLPNGNPHLPRQHSVEMLVDTWWDHPEEPRSESCRGSRDFSLGLLRLPDICWKIIMKRKTSWCVQLWQAE